MFNESKAISLIGETYGLICVVAINNRTHSAILKNIRRIDIRVVIAEMAYVV